MRVLVAAAGLVLTLAGPSAAEGGDMLDGFVIGHVPRDAGPSVSDFEYEPEDGVRFTSRVWERKTAAGYAVDLTVIVVRAGRFGTLGHLRDFMSAYHERDPSSWTAVQVGSRPGLKADDQVFWLVRPGVAVSVALDTGRFGAGELLAVAERVRER
ncbi:hypothetical protein Misp01_45630 [Microtetraspora sp. NBRC 13810]|nr:hypothetical protein Misp01_45630 [Microtetraspora sp. NBRC 13810]